MTRTASTLLAIAAAVALLLDDGLELSALQKMAGYTTGKTFFKDARQYLDNLRDRLIPLAIPLGAIGLRRRRRGLGRPDVL